MGRAREYESLRARFYLSFDSFLTFVLVDYILLVQKDVEIKPNPNEVRDVKYVSKDELKKFVATHKENGLKLTPWFALIVHNFLDKWWDNLHNLESQYDHTTIHHM